MCFSEQGPHQALRGACGCSRLQDRVPLATLFPASALTHRS